MKIKQIKKEYINYDLHVDPKTKHQEMKGHI